MEFRKEVQELAELTEFYMDVLQGEDMAALPPECFQEAVNMALAHQHLTERRDITFLGYFPNKDDAWKAYAAKLLALDQWPWNVTLDTQSMERMHGDKVQGCNDYYFLFP